MIHCLHYLAFFHCPAPIFALLFFSLYYRKRVRLLPWVFQVTALFNDTCNLLFRVCGLKGHTLFQRDHRGVFMRAASYTRTVRAVDLISSVFLFLTRSAARDPLGMTSIELLSCQTRPVTSGKRTYATPPPRPYCPSWHDVGLSLNLNWVAILPTADQLVILLLCKSSRLVRSPSKGNRGIRHRQDNDHTPSSDTPLLDLFKLLPCYVRHSDRYWSMVPVGALRRTQPQAV